MRTTKTTRSLPRGRPGGAPPEPRAEPERLAAPAGHLRRLRRAADLTAEELADRLRTRGWAVSGATIYNWEQGRRTPPRDLAGAYAASLGVRVRDLEEADA